MGSLLPHALSLFPAVELRSQIYGGNQAHAHRPMHSTKASEAPVSTLLPYPVKKAPLVAGLSNSRQQFNPKLKGEKR